MKSKYYNYLKSLSKSDLIKMLYSPLFSKASCSLVSTRNIALRLSYDGKNFSGVQHHNGIRSVADYLLNALELSNLNIDSNLTFCGRTDKGVSAISMVVNLIIKSKLANPNRTYKIVDSDYQEYPYDVILNTHLPEDIVITGWAPVPDDFSARHRCIQRQYRYYFLRNNLNIQKMEEAAARIALFKNFYRLSTHSNSRAIYDREIDYIKIKGDENQYYLDIGAKGFLHNMVRKIFWTIKSCGEGREFSIEKVEKAEPENLVFIQGIFKENLNFLVHEGNKMGFKIDEEKAKINYEILKIRRRYYE